MFLCCLGCTSGEGTRGSAEGRGRVGIAMPLSVREALDLMHEGRGGKVKYLDTNSGEWVDGVGGSGSSIPFPLSW